jgi:hypothetical protein
MDLHGQAGEILLSDMCAFPERKFRQYLALCSDDSDFLLREDKYLE